MPHVIVKLPPGKSEQQKVRHTEAIVKDVTKVLNYGPLKDKQEMITLLRATAEPRSCIASKKTSERRRWH